MLYCPVSTATRPMRYSAFLSYSRHDSRDARWLQSALEAFRMPRRLVGTAGAHGPVPARFLPVFLDRSDLAAASNLAGELDHAMASSQWMIVVSTPWAAGSDWVEREIRMMLAADRMDHILPALFDGDERNAFPPALREGAATPLAADFRSQGDGRRLALLKLVSAMAGVPLGELVHREATRRHRRLAMTCCSALAILALLASISLWALTQQRTADAEQARSLAMVETMLTDMRNAVKPMGSLHALEVINEAASRHFDGKPADRLTDQALAQRAKLLLAMGEDAFTRGQLTRAGSLFAQAHQATGEILERQPGQPDSMLNHIHSAFWIGQHAWIAGKPDLARSSWDETRLLALKLRSLDPDNPDYQLELAYAESNLGQLDLRQRLDVARAEQRFSSALTAYQLAYMGRQNEQAATLDLSDGLAWLADSQRLAGKLHQAQATRLQQKAVLEAGLVRADQSYLLRRQLMANHIALGRIFDAGGDWLAAIAHFQQARQEGATLMRADPANAMVAQSARMAQLFELRAQLRSGATVNGGSAGCSSAAISSEVEDWCRLVEARQMLQKGPGPEAAKVLEAVAVRRLKKGEPRLSADFGLDFASELMDLQSSASG